MLRRIVEDEYPVAAEANGWRGELVLAGVVEFSGGGDISAAGVEPGALHTSARDLAHVGGERAAFGAVDERIAVTSGCRDMVHAFQFIGDKRLIGDSGERGAGFEQVARILHFSCSRTLDGFVPVHERTIDRNAAGSVHLPDGVIAVGVTAGTGEEVPVQIFTDVRIEAVAV